MRASLQTGNMRRQADLLPVVFCWGDMRVKSVEEDKAHLTVSSKLLECLHIIKIERFRYKRRTFATKPRPGQIK